MALEQKLTVMPSEYTFDMYANAEAPRSKKKASRRHPGESSSDHSKKKAQKEDPPVPTPFKTPPPKQEGRSLATTPPPPPRNSPPPKQAGRSVATELMSSAYNATHEKLQRISRHCRSQEAFSNLPPLKNSQVISRRLSEVLSVSILPMSHSWHRAEETKAKHAEEIKACEEKAKAVETKVSSLSEELKKCQEALAKVIATKEKFKEASEINFKEATKLQDDLAASLKGATELEGLVKLLEETNAQNLEKFRGATFNCFYLFWKNTPGKNFDYLPENMR
ncbi:uncharacterized protein LOC133779300 [Humulus lupulus]|uniref:uncharacterized protein LOC133779300 n=1 Tax=Humulus lupulus TaxID=3486 RepID=UPI002B418671|nr:uncharacterized protein LOC133779300 [Humulus lupulus]